MDDLDEVAVLLKDPVPEVRGAALLAVGPADEKVVSAKSLLPVLHDDDPEVRRACEDVLRIDRHLSPQSYQIGWCLYHPDPAQRLNVLDHLQRGADVEPGVGACAKCCYESPAVRLAAVRVMSQQHRVDLSDRLKQMAEGDQSPHGQSNGPALSEMGEVSRGRSTLISCARTLPRKFIVPVVLARAGLLGLESLETQIAEVAEEQRHVHNH